ncbi:hypothetical protein AgCh_029716 [Apium graveolens]
MLQEAFAVSGFDNTGCRYILLNLIYAYGRMEVFNPNVALTLLRKGRRMATFELYRRSTIGMCLTETLDEMVDNGVLSPELAIQVLVQFDKSMTEALESQVKSKVTIKVNG